MKKLRSVLRSSYPFTDLFNEILKRALIYGFFVGAFLYFFRPFGMASAGGMILLQTCFIFAAITVIEIILSNYVLPKLFPRAFQEENWNVGKEILFVSWNVFWIGVGNTFFLHLSGWNDGAFAELLFFMQFNTLGIGIFPIVFFTVYDQNRLLQKHLRQAQRWNEEIDTHTQGHPEGKKESEPIHSPTPQENRNETAPASRPVTLPDENGKEELTVSTQDVMWIASDRNYLDVFVWQDNQLQKHLIRNRLKNLEELLPESVFFRCHRSYMVNTDWVVHVKGNARGYSLHLKNTEETVPVSRNKIPEMEERLELN